MVDLDQFAQETSSGMLDLSSEISQTLDNLEEDSAVKTTLSHTSKYSNRFRKFLEEKRLPTNFEDIPERYLNQYLRYFYSELRQADGSFYSPATLICIRAAIHRRLTTAPINRNVDILHSSQFASANNMLRVMVGKALKQKKLNGISTTGTGVLEKEDMLKLSAYFNRVSPTALQDEVFFKLCYHFGFRGREWIRDLKKDDVFITTDGEGRELVDLKRSNVSKNVKASLSAKDYDDHKVIVMYAVPQDLKHCPVTAIKLYLSKIPPEMQDLFPKPLKRYPENGFWYCGKSQLGKNTLGNLMKSISTRACLRKAYTNHCIRATVVCELKEKNVPVEDIQLVTGHKRAASVERYVKRVSDAKKKRLSDTLAEAMSASECIIPREGDYVQQLPHSQAFSNIGGMDEAANNISAEIQTNQTSPGLIAVPTMVVNASTINSNASLEKKSVKYESLFSNCSFSNCSFSF